MMCVQPWPRSTLSKTNKTVLKVHGFGSGRKIKSINFLAEVELNVFFQSPWERQRKGSTCCQKIRQNLLKAFPKQCIHRKRFCCGEMFGFFLQKMLSIRGCQAALP